MMPETVEWCAGDAPASNVKWQIERQNASASAAAAAGENDWVNQ